MSISIGICGNGHVDPKMRSSAGQEFILRLCEGPVDIQSVEPELLESFTKMRAIRIDGSQCLLNFTCFLKKDIEHLNSVCDELGRELAGVIADCLNGRIPDMVCSEVEQEKHLFFLVGCVSLDWHGLKTLTRLGLTLDDSEMEKPGYGCFTVFANESAGGSVKELYWGSHNSTHGDYVFTTFGDHSGVRDGFPDLVWQAEERVWLWRGRFCFVRHDRLLSSEGRRFAHVEKAH